MKFSVQAKARLDRAQCGPQDLVIADGRSDVEAAGTVCACVSLDAARRQPLPCTAYRLIFCSRVKPRLPVKSLPAVAFFTRQLVSRRANLADKSPGVIVTIESD